MSKKKNKTWKSILRTIMIATVTILVVMCIRILWIASFHIPSSSMAPSLLPGDVILTNKLIPGPRMDWLYLFNKKEYKRIEGSRKVQRGDVIVFNPPYYQSDKLQKNMEVYYVKRCVGIPGDSLYVDKEGGYRLISKEEEKENAKERPVYKLPHKGDEVLLDSTNIHFYQRMIDYDRNNDTNEEEKNEIKGKYRFRYNYYFMVGDNRGDSEDSRYWGLLPETHIVGKATYVWRSIDPTTKKMRWSRFFKPL